MTNEDRCDVMELNITLSREAQRKIVKVDSTIPIIEIIRNEGLPIDGVLVISGGRPVPVDISASDLPENSMTVINVASGG